MSTRSSKRIRLLLVEPLDLERVIHKSKRAVDTLQGAIGSVDIQASINTIHPPSIDTVHPPSIDTVHPDTVHRNTVHSNTVHPNTVHPDTVHPVKNDTTCGETEKIEELILKVEGNGMLRDEEGRTRNNTWQLINAQGAVIPYVIDVAEMNDFDLSREWYDWVGQDPFQGLPHQDPRNQIEDLEDLVWFSQLQPGSLTSWEDIERAFLYKFLDDAEATREKEKNDKWDMLIESWQIKRENLIPRQLVDYIRAKDDEQHGSEELSRLDKADKGSLTSTSTNETTSTSTDGTTSTSTDGTTSTSTDGTTSMSTDGRTSTSTDSRTSTSTDGMTSTSTDGRTSTSTNGRTSTSTEGTASTSIDRTTSQSIDIMTSPSIDTSTSTSIDTISSCRSTPLEINDRSSCFRDSADSTQKSTDHPPDIDRYPPDCIDRHPPDNIDRHPGLDELSGYIVEVEPIEERMYMSKASHFAVPKHQKRPIRTEEAARFHKRVKRIHDPVKIVVPCTVFEAESPIPPDRSMQISSYMDVLDDHQHVEASQRGLRFRDEVDKGPTEAASIDTDRMPSNDTTYAILNDINKLASIDATTSPSIDTGRVLEKKELDVCGNIFDGETTT
ncbi:hypothetical protein F2Q70_00038900 [Brassica cretica]|uniref:Retrotransposon gag domain-containing protein n=2 Tax=Brassica cretica TaxID=69181 RepID=A0A8S9K6R0_BRACR|nr:hypothetical protein F2Q70_00038900 [Brassica cretica]